MQAFKVTNYEREHGPGSFPTYVEVDAPSVQAIRRRVARVLGIDHASGGHAIVTAIRAKSEFVAGVPAESEMFDLRSLLRHLGLTWTDKLYLNWYQFDSIDELSAEDAARHFSDIWYPSADDLDIFDRNMEWILSVSHYGAVSVLRMKGK